MDSRRLLATLARQIDASRRQAARGDGRGDLVLPLFHSLRVTYLAISTGLDPQKDASHLFILSVSHTGEHLLLQGGRPVPINGPYLASLFSNAGIELVPGQFLLLEPELAKDAIEEALGGLALAQALVDRDRSRRQERIDDTLALPPQEDLDALRAAEERANQLGDRKIELVAASLVADEYLERARELSAPDCPDPGIEAA